MRRLLRSKELKRCDAWSTRNARKFAGFSQLRSSMLKRPPLSNLWRNSSAAQSRPRCGAPGLPLAPILRETARFDIGQTMQIEPHLVLEVLTGPGDLRIEDDRRAHLVDQTGEGHIPFADQAREDERADGSRERCVAAIPVDFGKQDRRRHALAPCDLEQMVPARVVETNTGPTPIYDNRADRQVFWHRDTGRCCPASKRIARSMTSRLIPLHVYEPCHSRYCSRCRIGLGPYPSRGGPLRRTRRR